MISSPCTRNEQHMSGEFGQERIDKEEVENIVKFQHHAFVIFFIHACCIEISDSTLDSWCCFS